MNICKKGENYMKRSLLFCLMFSLFVPLSIHADPEKDAQAKKVALEIIAALSDDIATLIINKHHEKDPQITKIACLNLVTRLADVIASVIIKIKERKETRGIDLLSDDDYQNELYALAMQLAEKSLQLQISGL